MSKNKVKFGLSNCWMAPLTVDATTGEYTYDTPIRVPGAVNLSLSASGDSNDFYADNVIYFNSTANQGYEGDLEIALIPDEIRTQILGETVDSNGAFIENANDRAKEFAFGFQINGDQTNRKYWYYNCSLTRPNLESSTIESSIEPKTDTMTLKAMPRLSDQQVRAYLEPTEESQAAYDAFFESVYEAVVESSNTNEGGEENNENNDDNGGV